MFVVLDLETTGLIPKEDTIIEAAFIKIDRQTFKEVDRLSTFINPGREIPEIISQITNIFDTDVENAPKFSLLQDDIQDFIEGLPLIGHNIPFDIRFLDSHGIDVSKNPTIDTFFLANFLCYDEKSLNLGYLCESFSIKLDSAHRAIDDTLATVQLFEKLIKKLQKLKGVRKDFVYHYFSKCQDMGVRILRDEYLEKSDLSEEKMYQKYIKTLQKNKFDIQDTKQEEKLQNIDKFIENIPGFELRENQKKMLDTVDKTFQKGGKTLIEAPTGIGKTFAYLLPAIKHSLEFGEPVHISTSTKALQDQIYYKDLDFLQKHFSNSFSFTKLKGKRNYLGVYAFFDFLSVAGDSLSSTQTTFILKILHWSLGTEFGELDELDFYGEEFSFIPEIHAGGSFVFDESNPYKDVEFVIWARTKAKKSDIIITNNHILFQDIISEGSLLGGVKNLVLDEAHSLEDIVTQSLTKSLSYGGLEIFFGKVEKRIKKLNVELSKYAITKQEVLFDGSEMFSILEGTLFEKFTLDTKYKTLLLTQDFFTKEDNLEVLAHKISNNLEIIRQEIYSLGEKKALHFSSELQEILYFKELLSEVFFDTDFQKHIYYIVHNEYKGTIVHSTVLSPGKFLQSKLWSSLESVVLTSATLQMEDNFSYIKNVLELHDFDTLLLPSDFDYNKQALLFIPQDLGNIKNNLSEVISFLNKFFLTVKGRTLVLFTAFFVIREVFSRLKISLEQQDIHILAQSISGSKHKQIDFFKKRPNNSILLGTDTFWEGIDIPGEDLQYLLIHKIPFNVPSDPIFQARSKLFKDSFGEYAIPKAILKLKQGFGRLIRTKKDTGIVVFLDNRIYQTSWGQRFFEAFPKDIKIRYGTSEKLIELLSQDE